jgi:3-hydroxyisobutyrate dehydrogenase-like beta-hydroxyacid dehydrogenase
MAGAHAGRLGWIGAGSIGLPMLARLFAAGHRVVAFDQDPARARLARQAGAEATVSPAAVARASDAVFLCLPDSVAVREAVFGASGCIAGGMKAKLLIDTSSIDPKLTCEFAHRLANEASGRWIDAPVSGGARGAADGTLVAFLGGMGEDVAAARAWIGCFALRVVHLGPTGSGQWVKLCNQAIICGTIALWTEALALARAGGIDRHALVAALEGARADSPVRSAFGGELAAGRFVPSQNLRKDIATVLARAREAGYDTPMLAVVARLFEC